MKQKEVNPTAKNSEYKGILKYIGIFGGIQGIVSLITLFRASIVSHLLGPVGVGFNDVYNRTIDLGKKATDLGISYSAVQVISEQSEEVEEQEHMMYAVKVVRSWSLWLATLGTLLFFLLAPLLSRWGFDGDHSYTSMFRLLSLTIGCSVLMGGELAVLKGTRRLARLAWYQLTSAALVLAVAVPCYYLWGINGIVPSLLLSAISLLVVACWHSFKVFPYQVEPFSRKVIIDGTYIIIRGLSYTLAGLLNSGAYYLISIYIFSHDNAAEVGCYSYGMLFISYLSMLAFAVLDNDFFPRLSAVNKDKERCRQLINNQIEILTVLITPLIISFAIFLPLITRLLLEAKFMPLVVMTQIGVVGLFFKAMMHPPAYLSLSKGESLIFLLQEALSYTFMAAVMIAGFKFSGLKGLGFGLLLSNVFDWLTIWIITTLRYQFKYSSRVWKIFCIQCPSLIGLLGICLYTQGWLYAVLGCAVMIWSAAYSIRFFHKNTNIITRLSAKIRKSEE